MLYVSGSKVNVVGKDLIDFVPEFCGTASYANVTRNLVYDMFDKRSWQ